MSDSSRKGPFEVVDGQDSFPSFSKKPDVAKFSATELRFRLSYMMELIEGDGDWLKCLHYKDVKGALVGRSDLEFLMKLGRCVTVDDLMAAFTEWPRCGDQSPLAGLLLGLVSEVRTKVRRLSEFDACQTSSDQFGNARSVEFGGALGVSVGHLSLTSTKDSEAVIYGFLERDDPSVKLVLEFPDGQIIDSFDEDGLVLNLRRTAVTAPIALLEVRVRRL